MKKANSNNVELKNLSKESITTALFILIKKMPYDQISIKDICQRAGVSRTSFYRSFPAKDAIMRQYLFEITDVWRKNIRQYKPLNAYEWFLSIYRQLYDHREIARFCFDANLDYLIIDIIFKALRDYSRTFEFPDYVLCHYSGSIYATFKRWITKPNPESAEQLAHIACKINHLNEDSTIFLPPVSDVEYLMSLDNFEYQNKSAASQKTNKSNT